MVWERSRCPASMPAATVGSAGTLFERGEGAEHMDRFHLATPGFDVVCGGGGGLTACSLLEGCVASACGAVHSVCQKILQQLPGRPDKERRPCCKAAVSGWPCHQWLYLRFQQALQVSFRVHFPQRVHKNCYAVCMPRSVLLSHWQPCAD